MLTETVLNQLLIDYPVMHHVPSSLQHQVLQTAVAHQLPANHLLFQEGDACNQFIMLLSGSVRVVKPDVSGREMLLYRIRPGDSCILTVSCLLGNQRYAARGVLDRPVTAVSLPKSLFIELITASAPFRIYIFKFFGQRLAELVQLIEQISFQQLDQRLALLLLRRGAVMHTTHQQLADELGSVREVISRLLNDFKEQGAVMVERGKIQIINKTILEQIAQPERDLSH